MSSNKNMRKAAKVKNDEFYTQYNDIANEVSKYKLQLIDKHILCPCDWDAKERTIKSEENIISDKCNFAKFLNSHFNEYQLKSITISGYNPETGIGKKFQDSIPEFAKKHPDGIIITNPPFSQFIEFITTIAKYPNLKFLVIGNKNAALIKEIFKLFTSNKIWLGYNSPKKFMCINSTNSNVIKENGITYAKFGNIGWFTNLDVDYRKDKMILTEEYTPEKYPKYDNYDAINVDKISDIPENYYGVMGVPITFLDKYNPKQFKIIDGLNRYTVLDKMHKNKWAKENHKHMTSVNGKPKYFRILIKAIKNKKGKK